MKNAEGQPPENLRIEVCPSRHTFERFSTWEGDANNHNVYGRGRVDTPAGALKYFTERFKEFTIKVDNDEKID